MVSCNGEKWNVKKKKTKSNVLAHQQLALKGVFVVNV